MGKQGKYLKWGSVAFLLVFGLCILGVRLARPNILAQAFLEDLQQNKITKIEIINCSTKGFIIMEVIPPQPALHFHIWAKQRGNLQGCKVSIFDKTSIDEYESSRAGFLKVEELWQNLGRTNFLWDPMPSNIVMDGIYFYEPDGKKIYAIYFAQHRFGAIAVWTSSAGEWILEELENTYNANFYVNVKNLFMPTSHSER